MTHRISGLFLILAVCRGLTGGNGRRAASRLGGVRLSEKDFDSFRGRGAGVLDASRRGSFGCLMMNLYLVSLCVLLLVSCSGVSAAEPPRWALVVHGGAAGDPEGLSVEEAADRREGLRVALEVGRGVLAGGGAAVDAVERTIRILEDDVRFNAGRGAVLNVDGVARLDASIMEGRDHRCGGVGGLSTTRHPISGARRVMTSTPHVLLVGPDADDFARTQGLEQVDRSFFLSQPKEVAADARDLETVGCVALDVHGDIAAGTSTGGTTRKLAGRIGDSPIIGAGTYADNATCGVSCTGVGEEYIRNAVAYDVSARMKYMGQSVGNAVESIFEETLPDNIGGIIALSKDGTVVTRHNTAGMAGGLADSRGRMEVFLKVAK